MEEKAWDFDSGNLVLDFANTAEFHASKSPDEMLESYADLLAWSQAAGVLSGDEAADLRDWAEENPGEAGRRYRTGQSACREAHRERRPTA